MLKIPRKLSITISLTISVMLFLICIAAVFIMPELADMLLDVRNSMGNSGDITEVGRVMVHVLAYAVLAIVVLADGLMFLLLLRVKGGNVFTGLSVSLIRGVSWCCFLLCAVFGGIGIYFQLAFIIAFAALFLGTCLRVTKNVIEEATEIKSENDLTV